MDGHHNGYARSMTCELETPTPTRVRIGFVLTTALLATAWFLSLLTPNADAQSVKIKILERPDRMFICNSTTVGQRVQYMKVRVTPAVRGRTVYVSRGYGNRVKDEGRGKTNSAGIATIKFKPRCGHKYLGKKVVNYWVNTFDERADRWRWAGFKLDMWRLSKMLTAGFPECVNIPVGEDCIVAATPAAGAFNLNRDDYYIRVSTTGPDGETQWLEIYDEYEQGTYLEILETPFAFGIVSFDGPVELDVSIWLVDSRGDPVALSKAFTISWA